MKAQKLGLVLGMNMAAACLVLQGCKATRPGAGNLPPPAVDPGVAVVEPVPAEPTPSQAPITVTPAPEPPPAVEPPPAKVVAVKPLPPPAVPRKRPAAVAPVPAATGRTIVVQRGDTLSGICVRHHVKMSAVVAANPGLKPNHIRIGQKIVLPGAAVAAVSAKAPASPKVMTAAAEAPVTAANTTPPARTKAAFAPYAGPTKAYKVRSGDTLGEIASRSGITIRALKELNKLSKDSIRAGQELLVPAEKVAAKPTEKPAAKAAKGADAPKPAAKKAEAKAEKAAAPKADEAKKEAAAPAESAPLTAAVEAPAVPPAEAKAEAAPAPAANTYTVKEGDDVVSVSIAWGISPSALMDLNDLKAGDELKAGQVLKLPANAKSNAQ